MEGFDIVGMRGIELAEFGQYIRADRHFGFCKSGGNHLGNLVGAVGVEMRIVGKSLSWPGHVPAG